MVIREDKGLSISFPPQIWEPPEVAPCQWSSGILQIPRALKSSLGPMSKLMFRLQMKGRETLSVFV